MAINNQVTGVTVFVVPASMTYVTLFQPSMRQHFSIYNNSTSHLYLKFTDDLMAEWTTKIPPNFLYETTMPLYRGIITGKWDNTIGDAHCTEFR